MTYARTTTVDAAPAGDTVKQGVLDVDTDLTGIYANLNTHETATTGIHGVGSGTLVSTTGTQTLTAKTISGATITGAIECSGATLSTPTITGATISNPTITGGTITGATFASPTLTAASDTAYGASWDAVTTIAPSKNAVYDELNARPRYNIIINGNFSVNQRVFASGGTLAEGAYGHDRWKAGTGGCNYTFAASEGKVTITIPSGKTLLQIVEGTFLQSGTYTLSWEGTAQGQIAAGGFATSPITASVTGGSDLTITFNAGTVANVQLELGSTATAFERRSIAEETALCQRYYFKNTSGMLISGQSYASDGSTDGLRTIYSFPTTMRVSPTVATVGGDDGGSNSILTIQYISESSCVFNIQSTDASFTVYWGISTITATAEL